MTALRPGASPPPVEIAIRILDSYLIPSLPRPSANRSEHLARLCMATNGFLGEHWPIIYGDLESAARRRHQLYGGVGKLALQLSRQTGGAWLVVSNDAVLDEYTHRLHILPKEGRPGRIVAASGARCHPPRRLVSRSGPPYLLLTMM